MKSFKTHMGIKLSIHFSEVLSGHEQTPVTHTSLHIPIIKPATHSTRTDKSRQGHSESRGIQRRRKSCNLTHRLDVLGVPLASLLLFLLPLLVFVISVVFPVPFTSSIVGRRSRTGRVCHVLRHVAGWIVALQAQAQDRVASVVLAEEEGTYS